MHEQSSPRNFEDDVLPHLDAAYNLARWLTRNDQEAEDVVQEASLRALRFFGGFRGAAPQGCDFLVVGHESFGRVEQVGPNVTEC